MELMDNFLNSYVIEKLHFSEQKTYQYTYYSWCISLSISKYPSKIQEKLISCEIPNFRCAEQILKFEDSSKLNVRFLSLFLLH